jgi:hypothetical protein
VVSVFFLGILFTTLRTFALTILVGILHSFLPEVPPIPWEAAWVIVLIVTMFTNGVKVRHD